MKKIRLAIFASGTGSNALNVINFFATSDIIQVGMVLSNKAEAGVVPAAKQKGVHVELISNQQADHAEVLLELCHKHQIDFVILAGYLRKIPAEFITHFPNKIINIHPSLLPKYGGAGMYGAHVHRAVHAAGEKESGITIHFVNEHFDEGRVLAQFRTALSPSDSPDDIAHKVQNLEHAFFPSTIDYYVKNTNA
jgi:phosphoribosylglycinamide formyltransferase 1